MTMITNDIVAKILFVRNVSFLVSSLIEFCFNQRFCYVQREKGTDQLIILIIILKF